MYKIYGNAAVMVLPHQHWWQLNIDADLGTNIDRMDTENN